MAAVASALGWDLLPWQRHVADVACEIDPRTGTWRYPTVIITTPRQAGKSSVLGAILAHRAMTQRDSLHWYTAQTGLAARDTWTKWEYKVSEVMPGRWKVRRAQGQESMTFRGTNGFVRAFPPTPKSLHGQQSDTVVIDECFSFTPDQGDSILQAVVPTQATRPMRQMFIISTAGNDESVWFRAWVEKGRLAAADPNSTIAFFEWSAPEDAPLDDPATWRDFHPGYPTLIDDAAMAAALDQFGPEGFARGYLNRWPTAELSWRAGWPKLATTDTLPADAPVFISADAAPNHRHASIVAAGSMPDGRVAVEVLSTGDGVDWVLPRLVDLHRKHRCKIIVQRTGPLGYMIEEMERAGVRVTAATESDYGDAVGRFRTMAAAGELAHQADPRLDGAVDGAVSRKRGDREVWSRKDASVDISPLVAATFAVWQAATPPPVPMVISLPR